MPEEQFLDWKWARICQPLRVCKIRPEHGLWQSSFGHDDLEQGMTGAQGRRSLRGDSALFRGSADKKPNRRARMLGVAFLEDVWFDLTGDTHGGPVHFKENLQKTWSVRFF